jgi:hypothetical protein
MRVEFGIRMRVRGVEEGAEVELSVLEEDLGRRKERIEPAPVSRRR